MQPNRNPLRGEQFYLYDVWRSGCVLSYAAQLAIVEGAHRAKVTL